MTSWILSKERLKPVVLERRQQAIGPLRGGGHAVNVLDGAGKRFFTDDMQAGLQRLDRGRSVQRRGQGIYKKVKTAFPDHCGIVGIGVGAEFAFRVPPPFRQLVSHSREAVLPTGLFQP